MQDLIQLLDWAADHPGFSFLAALFLLAPVHWAFHCWAMRGSAAYYLKHGDDL